MVRSNASYCGCGNTYSMGYICCADSTYPDSDGKCNSISKNYWRDGNLIPGRCENLFYSCISCPQGTVNPNSESWLNYYYTGTACKTCGYNTYVFYTQCGCQACPAGTRSYMTISGTASSVNDCYPCSLGTARQQYERLNVDDRCTACPSGKYADETGLAVCKTCPAGKSANGGFYTGATSCFDCASGQASYSGGSCEYCAIGKHPDASASSCVYCSPGKYADTNIYSASDCLECDYGKYSTSGVCVDCVAGTFANSKGSTTCSSCLAGQFSEGTGAHEVMDPIHGNFYRNGVCTDCPDGKSSDPSNDIYLCLLQCAVGKYAQGTPCTDCPSGTYNWFSEAAGCVSCSQNSFDYLTACQLCGGNGYKLVVNSNLVLKNHRFHPYFGNEYFEHTWGQPGYYKGYWDYEAGLTWRLRNVYSSSFSIVKIKLGFMTADCYPYCNDYAVSSEEKTEVAWFIFYGDESNKWVHTFAKSNQNWKDSQISGTSFFLDDYGGDAYFENINSAVTCQACPPGTYLGSDAFSCTPCPAGTYSSTVRATSVDTCLDCPAGTISPEAGASSCTDCQDGKYALDATVACQECPIGTYSATLRAVFDNCISCEGGKFGGDTGLTTCRSCPKGQFQNDIAQSACLNCPANMYANEYGLLACKPCKDCSGKANTTNVECSDTNGAGNCECYNNYLWVEDYSRCIDACDAEIEKNYYLDQEYVGHCET